MRATILAAVVAATLAAGTARATEQPAPGQVPFDQAVAILVGKAKEPVAKAVELLDQAVAAGHRDAAFLRGMLHVKARQPEQAAQLLTRAAEQGQGEAQNALAMLYLAGDGVARDEAQAVRWLTAAAEAQVATAQSNLGYLYLNGTGVARDPGRAAELMRVAAGKGITEAQHNMAWMYQSGEGVPKDMTEAVRWYRLAADAGYSRSQYNLGLLLAVGKDGVRQNVPEAVKWLSLAAVSPRPDVRQQASAHLVTVSGAVPAAMFSEGVDDARRWLVSRRVY